MSANSSSLSFTQLTYLAGMLWEFPRSRIVFMSSFCIRCVIFLEQSPSSAVFCCVDPIFYDLVAAVGQIFCLVLNLFEEFVNVIFSSFSWSSDLLSWSCILFSVQGSSQQPLSVICCLVKWRFSMPISISFSFLWLLQCFTLCIQSSVSVCVRVWKCTCMRTCIFMTFHNGFMFFAASLLNKYV